MLIATFGPSTGWAGKTITREGEVFTLEDHGPISAADVMEYDRQGHLVWANEGTRAWVGAKSQSPASDSAGGAALHTDTTQALAVQDADDKPPIECYGVNYRGGHPAYPKAKVGKIEFSVFRDRFELQPTLGSKWFAGLTIPYSAVLDLDIVQRQVNTVEGLLGGLDSRQLNQANNIHITYQDDEEMVLLRLEMLSGITVMGQAKKCREFEDRLRVHGIRGRLRQTPSGPAEGQVADDIPAQIEKLAGLRDKGILSDAEFEAKKTDLLSRM